MKYNISKELFETVMGTKALTYSIEERKNSKVIVYSTGYIGTKTITVNDFFFRCKEWLKTAVSHAYSGFDKGRRYFCHIEYGRFLDYRFFANSEQQAVFDACQWILDNKEK